MALQIQKQIALAQLTSWQVGGPAEFFCSPQSVDEIIEAVLWAKNKNVKITILSGGTNVLISDLGVEGLVIHLSNFKSLRYEFKNDRIFLFADAGCAKSELLKIFLKFKLAPSLFLAGLPGDVGSGVVMNAGVSELIEPREFCEIVEELEVFNLNSLQINKFSKNQITWKYRHSEGWQPGIVTKIIMSWPMVEQANILDDVRLANRNRLAKQPLDLPNCGSVFINPPGLKSAKLIDDAGLKGFTIGGAQISKKHANFIVNIGGASAYDINKLISYIKTVIIKTTGVDLATEVIYLGTWDQKSEVN